MNQSKKILLLSLLVLFVISGITFYVYSKYFEKTADTDIKNASIEISNQINPFTDTLDTTPVLSNFEIASSTTDSSSPNTEPAKELNSTERFAQDLFAKYLETQENTPITPENADQFTEEYLKNLELEDIKAVQYTTKDVYIEKTSKIGLQNYLNNVRAITMAHWPTENGEFTILDEALSTEDLTKLAQLKPLEINYQSIVIKMKQLQVPQSIVLLHLNVLNSLENYIVTLQALQKIDTDPINTLIGLRTFTDKQEEMINSFINLRIFIENELE